MGPMSKPSLSAIREQSPSKTSPCSRCQHAEFIHAYAGPCLFHDCECPFFTPEAEPDVEDGREPASPSPQRAIKPAPHGEPRYASRMDVAWRWLVGGVVAIGVGLTVWWTAFVLVPVGVVLLVIGITKSVRSTLPARSR